MARIPIADMFSLTDKTAIITGATQPLAAEMSRAMAEAGADIVAIISPWDPPEEELEELIRLTGRSLRVYRADVGNIPALRACFSNIWKESVEPDILLNFSTINQRGTVEEMTDDSIDLIFAVNLKGAYVAAQEFGSRLLHLRRPGKIINFASLTAHLPMTHVSAYAAAKAGVVQMTRAMSNDYSKTAMTSSLTNTYPEMDQYITGRTPAGRWATSYDFRGVIVFLSTPASDFITGTTIVVDGGLMDAWGW
ncbi:hypothetical protein FE257_013010 [Aspergillus nanangensis]|uniref:SDR family oxidoreductase n=1 Tax=Aspergillus nanangensis TaxID=2582783 RepID=A0AAD4CGS8_ASPNN|nr:hypothetical protein FE257_013010 [Aspergillus nanangensis]